MPKTPTAQVLRDRLRASRVHSFEKPGFLAGSQSSAVAASSTAAAAAGHQQQPGGSSYPQFAGPRGSPPSLAKQQQQQQQQPGGHVRQGYPYWGNWNVLCLCASLSSLYNSCSLLLAQAVFLPCSHLKTWRKNSPLPLSLSRGTEQKRLSVQMRSQDSPPPPFFCCRPPPPSDRLAVCSCPNCACSAMLTTGQCV